MIGLITNQRRREKGALIFFIKFILVSSSLSTLVHWPRIRLWYVPAPSVWISFQIPCLRSLKVRVCVKPLFKWLSLSWNRQKVGISILKRFFYMHGRNHFYFPLFRSSHWMRGWSRSVVGKWHPKCTCEFSVKVESGHIYKASNILPFKDLWECLHAAERWLRPWRLQLW